MRAPRPEIGLEHLYQVCTLTEACRAWKKGRTTLLWAIDTGGLTARRIGRDWLISVPSLERRWGRPIRPLER